MTPTPPDSGRGDDLSLPETLLPEALAAAITMAGPMSIAQFMGAANTHYYATRDPLGTSGDFVTAPEISQMFGELIGLWAADLWDRAGRPDVAWVELGPGRGTLTADALRAMAKAGLTPPVHFVETSPVLSQAQRQRVPDATWHRELTMLPDGIPLIVIANEFFDALPIRQLVKRDAWHERLVACQDTLFLPISGKAVPDDIVPPSLRDAPIGSILETSPDSVQIMRAITKRLTAQGGAMLAIDYGYDGPALGDTLQAVRGHGYANPFDAPGEHDLTAHVDFTTLAAAAQSAGGTVWGPVAQRDLLGALGIDSRTSALAKASPDRDATLLADRNRLMNDMGQLFRAIGVTAPGWPAPAGFA